MNDLERGINNINNLTKAELARLIQLCDVVVKKNDERIKKTTVGVIKLKLANQRDQIRHKRQMFVSKFHQV
jgi:hypothetical protein